MFIHFIGGVSISNSRELKSKGLPPIHYAWVGPPSPEEIKKGEREIKGHDTDGVIAMAQANSHNPIIFWCLDEYIEDYKKKFQFQKNIQVRSIEENIKKQAKNEKHCEISQKMAATYTKYLEKDTESTILDRITVKDAYILFLHATEDKELYTLDTNVRSIYSRKVILPNNDGFRVPQADRTTECWAMHSADAKLSTQIFNKYYNYLRSHEDDTGNAIITALNSYKSQLVFWGTENIIYNEKYIIPELNLVKTYFNTHKQNFMVSNVDISNPYLKALQLTKEYIILHPWQLDSGGKSISLANQKIKVPTIVKKIWDIIIKSEKEKDYDKAFFKLCNLVIKDDKKSHSGFLFFGGKRSEDTSLFLLLFPDPKNGIINIEQYTFGITSQLERDYNRKSAKEEMEELEEEFQGKMPSRKDYRSPKSDHKHTSSSSSPKNKK